MSKKDYILIGILFVVILWVLLNKPKNNTIIEKPDTSKLELKIDSLLSINKNYRDSINHAYNAIIAITIEKNKNINNLRNQLDGIKKFTPDSRLRWNDSVLRAAGLR